MRLVHLVITQHDCSLGNLVGRHSRLGATEDLQPKLFNICTRRNIIRDRLIVRVLGFDLFPVGSVKVQGKRGEVAMNLL